MTPDGLMKIGELAKAAGESVSTVKYYVREGLIQPARKTGRNMAWYSEENVSRLRLIKSLQRERFYPLSVIRRLLEAGDPTEYELLDAIHKVDPLSGGKPLSSAELLRCARLTRSQLERLVISGLIAPKVNGRRREFSEDDLRVALLIRRRLDGGIPFEQSLSAFSDYLGAIQDAARRDVDSFISGALMVSVPDTEDAARMIRISDETLDGFIALKRKQLNRQFGSGRIGDLEHFSARLELWLDAAIAAFGGSSGDTEGVRLYRLVISSVPNGLAGSVAACGRANEFFTAMKPDANKGAPAVLDAALRLGWLTLSPPLPGFGGANEHEQDAFIALTRDWAGDAGAALASRLCENLSRKV